MYNLKVLYAEDNELIRAQYLKVLNSMFFKVYECVDGEEALDYYNYYSPDIIILDINMPKINGLKVANKIREDDKNTKIIIISSLNDQETLLDAIPLSLVTYMIKPVELSKLKTKMHECAKDILKKDEDGIVKINDKIKYDSKNCYLYDSKTKIKLTKNEKILMDYFVKTDFQNVEFNTLFQEIWDEYDYSLNKLRSLINRLNRKLKEKILVSQYGIGYKFNKEISSL